jgi:anti-sigma factor RsiW
MTSDPFDHPLREANWRRPLTQAEEAQLKAWLEAHPEARPDCEIEKQLGHALQQLPDAPVPSNFTALVLQAVERESNRPNRIPVQGQTWWKRWRWAAAQTALGAALMLSGLFAYQRVQSHRRAAEFAESVAAISSISSLPSPEILQDFDAIAVLNVPGRLVKDANGYGTTGPDEQLLTLLQ